MIQLLFLLLCTVAQPALTLDSFYQAQQQLSRKEQELFLNNGLARGILDAPRDRLLPLTYEWACYLKILSEYTTRQYTGFTIIDPLFMVPTQPRMLLGGDAQAAPIIDAAYLASAMDFRTSGLRIGDFEVSSFIRGKFGNLVYIGSLFSLWDASITLTKKNMRITFGQKEHPLAVPLVEPDLVALNWGSPITPSTSIAPQIKIHYYWQNGLHASMALYSSYFINDIGPYGILQDYKRWAASPAVAWVLHYTLPYGECGFGLSYKVIRPRLVTNNSFVDDISSTSAVTFLTPPVHNPDYVGTRHEVIGNLISTAYLQYKKNNLENKTQLIVGGNGMELLNLGGYGVSQFRQVASAGTNTPHIINFESSYTLIPYVSFFNDLSWRSKRLRLQPGIFVGYTQPLPTQKPLMRNPTTGKYEIYTIDLIFQYIQKLTNPKPAYEQIFGYLRIAPRIWLPVSAFMKCGIECNIISTWYGQPDHHYRAISSKPTTMIRSTLCTVIKF